MLCAHLGPSRTGFLAQAIYLNQLRNSKKKKKVPRLSPTISGTEPELKSAKRAENHELDQGTHFTDGEAKWKQFEMTKRHGWDRIKPA